MVDGAAFKLKRAAKHVAELNDLFRERRPFSLVLETNTQTGSRATRPKKDEAVTADAACICGDAIHNLRSALDHAYWEIVSPFATSDGQRKNIQFPFIEKAALLEEGVKNRLAHKVSDRFFKAMIDLRPYGEVGGNEPLWLIHEIDLIDKHKLLTPVADYARLSTAMLQSQAPDFPFGLGTDNTFSNCEFRWSVPPHSIDRDNVGTIRPPTLHVFEKKLDIPVDIIFSVGPLGKFYPVVQTVNGMMHAAKHALDVMRAASK